MSLKSIELLSVLSTYQQKCIKEGEKEGGDSYETILLQELVSSCTPYVSAQIRTIILISFIVALACVTMTCHTHVCLALATQGQFNIQHHANFHIQHDEQHRCMG